MRTLKNNPKVWSIGGVLCVLLAAWNLDLGPGPGSITSAQQDTWTTDAARNIEIRLVETRNPAGPPAYPVEPGDVLFFTNVGTAYGSKNPKNSVVVINARTRKPIAVSNLEDEWSRGWTSHGIGVSHDAKYVYLPGLAPAAKQGALLVLDARTLSIRQILRSPAERPHHIKNFRDWDGRQRVLVEDFNWLGTGTMRSKNGTGFYILDPNDDNKVIGGMTPGDLRGNPYAGFTSPDGRYLYYSAPGPQMPLAAGQQLKGWLAKIDMQTWTVVQNIGMDHYPLWTVFSRDGRWAWTTNSGDNKVVKVQRATGPGQADRVVAHIETGPGPYGLRMNIDDTEVWVADKGEGKPVRGRTITVIDAAQDRVKRTIETDCITNDHLILSPDGAEMWATCNQTHEVVVVDTRTYAVTSRIPMPNQGDSHGGSFVAYRQGPAGIVGETVSDQNGLHGSALEAARQRTPARP
jgi:DNA-binding beta-propeller fold protein YncE